MEISLIFSALIISITLHFGIQRIFLHYKKFDDFNHRSSHTTLATRTGGIGLFFTVLIISIFYYFNEIELFDYSLFIPLSIMVIVGVYDDLYNANFKLKFFLQIIVAKILIDQGFVISNYHGLFGFYEIPWFLSQLSTIFVFLVVVNAINFIDGIDGLAISIFLKSIILIEVFSFSDTHLLSLGFLTISSIIPLYYFNFRKNNKIFLGDSGSMYLGTIIMIYLLYHLSAEYEFKRDFNINKVIFSISIILYPLIDLFRVFVLRIKEKTSPFEADKNHIHHLILKSLGESHIKTLIIILLFDLSLFLLIIAKPLIDWIG